MFALHHQHNQCLNGLVERKISSGSIWLDSSSLKLRRDSLLSLSFARTILSLSTKLTIDRRGVFIHRRSSIWLQRGKKLFVSEKILEMQEMMYHYLCWNERNVSLCLSYNERRKRRISWMSTCEIMMINSIDDVFKSIISTDMRCKINSFFFSRFSLVDSKEKKKERLILWSEKKQKNSRSSLPHLSMLREVTCIDAIRSNVIKEPFHTLLRASYLMMMINRLNRCQRTNESIITGNLFEDTCC